MSRIDYRGCDVSGAATLHLTRRRAFEHGRRPARRQRIAA
jgi:hypothetical protein